MGFIMKGSPAKRGSISGTSGHRSALKKLAEQQASPAKSPYIAAANTSVGRAVKKTAKKIKDVMVYSKAKGKDENLDSYIKQRNEIKKNNPDGYKTSREYAKVQNKINEAYGVSKRYDEGSDDPKVNKIEKKQDKIKTKGEEKKTKIQTKADTRKAEVDENVDRRVTKKDVKKARREYGRGSQEVKEAKVGREKSRLTDLEGGKGGKKAKFLGNVRRKLSEKRLAKKERKAAEGRAEKTTETKTSKKKTVKSRSEKTEKARKGVTGTVKGMTRRIMTGVFKDKNNNGIDDRQE
jgi:hypothetical protein